MRNDNIKQGRPYKLRDGSWGAIVEGDAPARDDVIEVCPANGRPYRAAVDAIVWQNGDRTAVRVTRLVTARPSPDLLIGGDYYAYDATNNPYGWPNHDCVGDFGDW